MVSGSVCSNQFLRKLLFLESLCDSLLISSHPAYQKCKQFNLQKCPESIIYFFPSQLPSPQPFAKTFIILPWRFLILLLSFPPSSAQHPQPFFPKKSDLSLNVCFFFFFSEKHTLTSINELILPIILSLITLLISFMVNFTIDNYKCVLFLHTP